MNVFSVHLQTMFVFCTVAAKYLIENRFDFFLSTRCRQNVDWSRQALIANPMRCVHCVACSTRAARFATLRVDLMRFYPRPNKNHHENGNCTALFDGFVKFLEHLNKFKRSSTHSSRKSWVSSLLPASLCFCVFGVLFSMRYGFETHKLPFFSNCFKCKNFV